MAKDLKQVSCDPMCGFMVRSHDEDEIREIVKSHAMEVHNQKTSDKEVDAKMEVVAV